MVVIAAVPPASSSGIVPWLAATVAVTPVLAVVGMDDDGVQLDKGGEKDGAPTAAITGSSEGLGVVGRGGPVPTVGSNET
jgi:hypothetical protein